MFLAFMRKFTMLLLVTLGISSFAYSQSTVSGKVTNSRGEAASGITVAVKNTNNATSTNAEGMYTLSNVASNATLMFTGVGITAYEVAVGGRTTVDADVATSVNSLDEIVVIGYGTARKRDLTGSVATVSEKNFNKGVYTSADQLIQGKVAGVQMLNNSGAPGGASTVRIRGISAVTGSGQPLYVVDGVPLDGRSARPGIGDIGLGGSNPGSNPLNFINPNDIASIDILKDASATAIYGSRAAYGVVLVTTKKGVSGEPKIDFSASAGFSRVANKVRVLNAGEFREALGYYGLSNANDRGSNVDAFDAITRTGLIQNYTVGVSGGNENAKFRFSLGALDQEGIVKKTGIKKYTANLSGNFKFLESRKLGLDINIIPSQVIEDIAPISNDAGNRGSLIGNALQWNPTEKFRNTNAAGRDTLNVLVGGDLINPVALQEAITDRSRVTTILASISPYYKINKDLEYRFLYSINYSTGQRNTTIQPFINFPDLYARGRVRIGASELTTEQFTNTLNYNKQISKSFSVNAVAGYEYLTYSNKGYDLGGFGQSTIPGGFGNFGQDFSDYIQFTDPTNRQIGSFNDPTNELQSYFLRTAFNIKDKYLLTGTFRADGSTKFGKNNKYGYFPSVGAAWVVSNEEFFKVNGINSLKIRGGWGRTGNQEFPSGSAQLRYSFAGNGSGNFNAANNANPDLKWQSDRQYNIGFDLAVLKNRITVTVDYFNKRTADLLFPSEPGQPAAPGGVVKWVNLDGNIDNKGLEAAINASVVNTSDIGFDFGINATFVKNEVSGLSSSINTGGLHGQGISGTTVQVIRNGLPINAFVTRQFLGFDKASGLAQYTDGGDVLYYVGNPNPNTLLGMSTTFRYKKLSVIANLNGAFGYDIYNNTLNSVLNVGSINNGKNIALSVLRDPVKESFANPLTASSRYLESGDYLKLTNATLNYNVGNIGKSFKNLNIYVTGQNLFVITKYSGFDPEVNTDKNVNGVPSASIEYIPYPSARTITFGITTSF